MRTFTLLASILFLTLSSAKAQNILFEEDFETDPVTSMWNSFTDSIPNGPPPCGEASRGTTSDHNSSSVDFLNAQNGSYFLAVNPEDPCGGAYTAELESDTFDFSGVDSLYCSFRYFLGDPIWGGPTVMKLELITIENGVFQDTATLDTVFSDTNTWSNIDRRLSDSIINDSVRINLKMGKESPAGVDDLKIYEPTSTSVPEKEKPSPTDISAYPNPFSKELRVKLSDKPLSGGTLKLVDMTGRTVLSKAWEAGKTLRIDGSDLENGVYILEWSNEQGRSSYQRVIKR